MASERSEATVYFDGSCPLCRTEIAYYRGQDSACRLRFVDVSEPGAPTPEGVTQEAAMQRFHVAKSDGSIVSGAAAFATVWALLPGWRWASRLASLPGVTTLLEIAYRGFLPIRPYISRTIGRLSRSLRSDSGGKHP